MKLSTFQRDYVRQVIAQLNPQAKLDAMLDQDLRIEYKRCSVQCDSGKVRSVKYFTKQRLQLQYQCLAK